MKTVQKLTRGPLLAAIEHLYEALTILKSVLKEIENGSVRGLEISMGLATAWFQVNCCRIYTQADVNLEELIVEAMGLINDAKCMIDSLINWQKGMTTHGKLYISYSIKSAEANLNLTLIELEGRLRQKKRQHALGRITSFARY